MLERSAAPWLHRGSPPAILSRSLTQLYIMYLARQVLYQCTALAEWERKRNNGTSSAAGREKAKEVNQGTNSLPGMYIYVRVCKGR